ncbi:MAG: hypothetical protein F6K47_38055, partial [Symploca sp. SIO2E6]|nr:hypothetical protein [Symploca sp. SIO2E6]
MHLRFLPEAIAFSLGGYRLWTITYIKERINSYNSRIPCNLLSSLGASCLGALQQFSLLCGTSLS